MPQPTQPALSEQGEHARKVSLEEVVGDGGAKICELFNDIQLIVIDGDG